VPGRFAYGFRTVLHFADDLDPPSLSFSSTTLPSPQNHRQKCKSTIDCATRSSYQASRGPLRDAQSIVIHSRSVDICAWDYGTIYGWQSTTLSQSLLPTGFAGTVHSLRAFLNGRLRACLRACLGEPCLGEPRLGEPHFGWKCVFQGKLWPMEGSKSVKTLTLTLALT